ncbi:hypothetical protein K488DRAFT_67513 [Vararia minispora EC-137]|uniref:Uncharacterized protein n=1 Tax=Vararia minispora EC-137 TaxID=1314806 RepID=A0ACB8QXS8_9AGAM|nr:hypothetical protein K488DRAFT_67513 [Vararia minispora EC-137]
MSPFVAPRLVRLPGLDTRLARRHRLLSQIAVASISSRMRVPRAVAVGSRSLVLHSCLARGSSPVVVAGPAHPVDASHESSWRLRHTSPGACKSCMHRPRSRRLTRSNVLQFQRWHDHGSVHGEAGRCKHVPLPNAAASARRALQARGEGADEHGDFATAVLQERSPKIYALSMNRFRGTMLIKHLRVCSVTPGAYTMPRTGVTFKAGERHPGQIARVHRASPSKSRDEWATSIAFCNLLRVPGILKAARNPAHGGDKPVRWTAFAGLILFCNGWGVSRSFDRPRKATYNILIRLGTANSFPLPTDRFPTLLKTSTARIAVRYVVRSDMRRSTPAVLPCDASANWKPFEQVLDAVEQDGRTRHPARLLQASAVSLSYAGPSLWVRYFREQIDAWVYDYAFNAHVILTCHADSVRKGRHRILAEERYARFYACRRVMAGLSQGCDLIVRQGAHVWRVATSRGHTVLDGRKCVVRPDLRGYVTEAASATVWTRRPSGACLAGGPLTSTLPVIASTLLALDISCNFLGALPPSLESCTNLEKLNVSSNPLRALPIFVSHLTSLRVLISDSTGLSTLPSQLGALEHLHTLGIRRNKMYSLPVWLCLLPSLETLLVDGNPFQGPWKALMDPLLAKEATAPAYPPSTPMFPLPSATSVDSGTMSDPDEADPYDSPQGESNRPSPEDEDTIMPNRNSLVGRSGNPPALPNHQPPPPVPNSPSKSPTLTRTRTAPNRAYFDRNRGDRSPNTRAVSQHSGKGADSGYFGEQEQQVRRMKSAGELRRGGVATAPSTPPASPPGLPSPRISPPHSRPVTNYAASSTSNLLSTPEVLPPRFASLGATAALGVARARPGLRDGLFNAPLSATVSEFMPLTPSQSSRPPSPPPTAPLTGPAPSMSLDNSNDPPVSRSRANTESKKEREKSGRWGFLRKMSRSKLRSDAPTSHPVTAAPYIARPGPTPLIPAGFADPRSSSSPLLSRSPAQSSMHIDVRFSSMGALNIDVPNLSAVSASVPPSIMEPYEYEDPSPKLPGHTECDSEDVLHPSATVTPVAQPQPSPVSPPAPPPQGFLQKVGQSSSGNLLALPSPTVPTGRAAKRRSFLPLGDSSPAGGLSIPIPSPTVFVTNIVVNEGPDEGRTLTPSPMPTEQLEMAQRCKEERQREAYTRALRSVIAYLRDMNNLSLPQLNTQSIYGSQWEGSRSDRSRSRFPTVSEGQGRSNSEGANSLVGSLVSGGGSGQLRSPESMGRLRSSGPSQTVSVATTDSDGSGSEGRKYKDDGSKRPAIVREIIVTERTYVKGLQELVDIHVNPAAAPVNVLGTSTKETVVPAAERRVVFGGLDALFLFHRESFLPAIEQAGRPVLRVKSPAQEAPEGRLSLTAAIAVANTLVSHAAFMRMYSTYINNFDNAVNRIKHWTCDRPTTTNAGVAPTMSPSGGTAQIVGLSGAASLSKFGRNSTVPDLRASARPRESARDRSSPKQSGRTTSGVDVPARSHGRGLHSASVLRGQLADGLGAARLRACLCIPRRSLGGTLRELIIQAHIGCCASERRHPLALTSLILMVRFFSFLTGGRRRTPHSASSAANQGAARSRWADLKGRLSQLVRRSRLNQRRGGRQEGVGEEETEFVLDIRRATVVEGGHNMLEELEPDRPSDNPACALNWPVSLRRQTTETAETGASKMSAPTVAMGATYCAFWARSQANFRPRPFKIVTACQSSAPVWDRGAWTGQLRDIPSTHPYSSTANSRARPGKEPRSSDSHIAPSSTHIDVRFSSTGALNIDVPNLSAVSVSVPPSIMEPDEYEDPSPKLPVHTERDSEDVPRPSATVTPVAQPQPSPVSPPAPSPLGFLQKVGQSSSGNLLAPPSPTVPTGRAAKRRSFLPLGDSSPAGGLSIPVPSPTAFVTNIVVNEGPDEGRTLTPSPTPAEQLEMAQRREEERQREAYTRALRSVMAYLRDMNDLSLPQLNTQSIYGSQWEGARSDGSRSRRPTVSEGQGRSNSEGANSLVGSPVSGGGSGQLRSPESMGRLRSSGPSQTVSVATTDSDGSGSEGRKYKDDGSKRSAIVREIIETERTYVKGLQELVDIYVKPAAAPVNVLGTSTKETVVPAAERRVVFGGLDALFSFHRESFLPALEQASRPVLRVKSPAQEDPEGRLSLTAAIAVANTFVSHAAFMRMYSTYINNFDNAVDRIKHWTSDRPTTTNAGVAPTMSPSGSTAQIVGLGLAISAVGAVPGTDAMSASGMTPLSAGQRKRIKTYLKRCRVNPRHSQLNIEGYLLLPVQRIPRYRLLSEKTAPEPAALTTPPTFEYVDPLDKALAEIASLATNMNEGKREAEGRRKLVQWQARIRGRFPSPLVQPHRRLIMDGPLLLTRVVRKATIAFEVINAQGDTANVQVECLSPEQTPRSLVGILCNDLLVLCRDPSEGKDPNSQVDLWAVLRMQTLPQPASIVHGNILRLVDNKAILYFEASSTSDALTWFRAINLHIPTKT